jgi:DHA2 family multidrug resistance protein-like MFS transporter
MLLALLPSSMPQFPALRLLLLAGIGTGIAATVTFASSTIMNAAPPERGGMAASIEEVGFELGGALGVAVFGSVMTLAYARHLLAFDFASTIAPVVRDSFDELLRLADGLPAADAIPLREAGAAAFSVALRAVLVGVGLLWLATGLAIGARRAGTT